MSFGARFLFGVVIIVLINSAAHSTKAAAPSRIVIAEDHKHFIYEDNNSRFIPWGFNYLGVFEHLAEEDWHTKSGWKQIESDFREMKALGANVVRWHLQFPTYITGPDQADAEQLERLTRVLDLASEVGLYLDLTGLNCFRMDRGPKWYDELSEEDRWNAQAFFWETISQTCARRPEVFCYDLMNEPVVTAAKPDEHTWLTGELGGFYFVQRISSKTDDRDQKMIAKQWAEKMIAAIRKHDKKTLVTVGVIPWAFVWPTAKPVFYSEDGSDSFDFVSIHVYPQSGKLESELKALDTYQLGKPLLIEETFPLGCNQEEFETFQKQAGLKVDGWMSHYFGATPQEHRDGAEPAGNAVANFLEYWGRTAPQTVTSH